MINKEKEKKDESSIINKELIDYIFSDESKDYFTKTKSILDMPFHKYYHNIFFVGYLVYI